MLTKHSKIPLKYSEDGKVSFDPVKHIYRNVATDKILTSVTSVIRKIETPFNLKEKAEKKAKYLNIPVEEVISMWNKKKDYQSHLGDLIHSIFEYYYLTGRIKGYGNIPHSFIAMNLIDLMFKRRGLKFIASEYIVYNEFIAGQLDCIVMDKEGNLILIDFKTNDRLSYDNFGTYFKYPFNGIRQSKLSIYTFQLNIYKKLFNSKSKLKIDKMYVLHIKENSYEFFPIKDLSDYKGVDYLISGKV